MVTMPWVRRRPVSRVDRGGASSRGESIDGWLDTLHGLASTRRTERTALARAGHALRARLREQGG